jgi:hypothetical protein
LAPKRIPDAASAPGTIASEPATIVKALIVATAAFEAIFPICEASPSLFGQPGACPPEWKQLNAKDNPPGPRRARAYSRLFALSIDALRI